MNTTSWLEVLAYVAVLMALVRPVGWYLAQVFADTMLPDNGSDSAQRVAQASNVWKHVDSVLARLIGRRALSEMSWREYSIALLTFHLIAVIGIFGLQRFQAELPMNPQSVPNVPWDLALNTAVSFVTNTNWQAYSGETTMSYLTQMLGLTVQNFVSAAVGIAVLVALIRGLVRRECRTIGNFWSDLVRSVIGILLPLSAVWAILLVSQGVVQTMDGARQYSFVDSPAASVTSDQGVLPTSPTIPLGPAASQIAIKQLGTNGGGFFGVNSAHPLENPTPLSNFIQLIAILLIPAALCYSFGVWVGDRRQGWAIFATMLVIFLPLLLACIWAEQRDVPTLANSNVELDSSWDHVAGNMEGKELRFGVGTSALWATATTAASNGSVNAMHDSFTPLGGLVPMWLMQLGEVIFGGVGSGLYGMLVFAILTVFIAGLMVGRTPEYLGKKIEAFEMKMAAIVILVPPLLVLVGTAIAVSCDAGRSSVSNPGAHGFSQILYAMSSAGNNNGSAFGGLSANTVFYNVTLAVSMFISRLGLIVPVLAMAGSLSAKKTTPVTSGTLPTHTPLFVATLAGIVVLVGALTFIPALALGPIAEHLQYIAKS